VFYGLLMKVLIHPKNNNNTPTVLIMAVLFMAIFSTAFLVGIAFLFDDREYYLLQRATPTTTSVVTCVLFAKFNMYFPTLKYIS
jgi:hypothetical protein